MFCRHKWIWHFARPIHTFERGDSIPSKFETTLSGRCSKCGMPKTKTLKGTWEPPKRGVA